MVNNRSREIAPAIPFIFLHGTTGYTLDTTPTPMPWSHAHYITSEFQFTEDDHQIVIRRNSGGSVFRLYVQCGAFKKTGAPDYLTLQLYINGVAHACCLAHGAVSLSGSHADTTLISAFYANAGDVIEIYGSVDAGTADVEEDTARIIIEGLPMEGWNNRSGGVRNKRMVF